jgi:nucleotide-binding universal stress UspA family protein
MYSRILVPVDGSAPSRAGLKEAIALAAGTKATLLIVNVVNEPPLMVEAAGYVNYGDISEILLRNGQELVIEASNAAAKAGVTVETFVVDAGSDAVCDTIVDQAVSRRCELIVMGTHGRRGMKRLTLGSDAELVVRRSPVPVLLVKAVDGSS